MVPVRLVPSVSNRDTWNSQKQWDYRPNYKVRGYALLCVSYACSDLEVETQDEDEVYELQFGRYFAKGKIKHGLPIEE